MSRPKLNELVYPHHVIQLVDIYLHKLNENDTLRPNIGPDAWFSICLYCALTEMRQFCSEHAYSERLIKDVGSNVLPVAEAVKSIVKSDSLSSQAVDDIKKKIMLLSKREKDGIVERDIEDLVVFSLFIELVTEKLGEPAHIINGQMVDALGDKYPELVALIQARLGDPKDLPYQNLVAEGLYLIYWLRSLKPDATEIERTDFRLRLLKWVKAVSDLSRYLNPTDKGNLPTSMTIREVYLCAIILIFLDYKASGSLRKGDFEVFLDKLLGYSLLEIERKRLSEELFNVKILKYVELPMKRAFIIYTFLLTASSVLIVLAVTYWHLTLIIDFIIGLAFPVIFYLFNELFRSPEYFLKKARGSQAEKEVTDP